MTQIIISGKTFELHKAATEFNTSVPNKKEELVPVKYTREEFLAGIQKKDKEVVAFAESLVKSGSPYLKEVTLTEQDIDNIKVLEEADQKVKELSSAASAKDKEIEALKKELADLKKPKPEGQ